MIALSCGKWQMNRRAGSTSNNEWTPRFHSAPRIVAEPFDGDLAHPRHDSHTEHDVNRIGDFKADFGQRRIGRSHDVGNHKHGAAAHRAFEQAVQFRIRFRRFGPIVRRSGFFFCRRANESELFDPGNVVWIRAMQIRTRNFLSVQLDQHVLPLLPPRGGIHFRDPSRRTKKYFQVWAEARLHAPNRAQHGSPVWCRRFRPAAKWQARCLSRMKMSILQLEQGPNFCRFARFSKNFFFRQRTWACMGKTLVVISACSGSLPPMITGRSRGWAAIPWTSRRCWSACTLHSRLLPAFSSPWAPGPCSTIFNSTAHKFCILARSGELRPTRLFTLRPCCSGSRSRCICCSCSAAKWNASSASELTSGFTLFC